LVYTTVKTVADCTLVITRTNSDLEFHLKKLVGIMWTALFWLMTGCSAGLLDT